MEALKFGLDTFHPGPAATHDLQPLRSFGVVPEGIPETSRGGEEPSGYQALLRTKPAGS